ncbi:uncharacterized protein SCHCODRAFT_02729116 [Schizophyllum commune H4-8]|uniref:uncharacterized protein n=1 Tax=Schizophyllum commune (strain H4-8 / FGSC 9210) TaxID=578458 RepID=UPI00215E0CC7|nr:uncharacterized protein SCHCODRAFT_02519236 [Schizophyllum commune H4-8]XP_050200280.1 uncharacterized protein SCHCODRAFT_02729116 [Schizophyllum commune H4-8]KAI5886061.1 hypothetical protein SCHCODRAFT_02519236 [Schizophyllum commune H4-8]KAI5893003.1 hypothetical protein SCHCODRAFT_02729116 [Schizophyllum commune H4-8]
MPKGKKRKAEETGRGKGTAGRDRKDVYPKGMRMGVLLHGEDEWFGQGATVHMDGVTKQPALSPACHSNTHAPSQLASSAPSSPKSHPRTPSPSPSEPAPQLQPEIAQVSSSQSRRMKPKPRTVKSQAEEVQRRRKILEQSKQEMEKSRATIVDLARAHTADSLAAMGEEQLKEILTDRRELDPQRSAEENTVRLCLWLGVALPPCESLKALPLVANPHLVPKVLRNSDAPPPMLTKKAALAREQERTRHKAQHSLGAGGDTSSESEDSDDSSDSSDLDDRLDGEVRSLSAMENIYSTRDFCPKCHAALPAHPSPRLSRMVTSSAPARINKCLRAHWETEVLVHARIHGFDEVMIDWSAVPDRVRAYRGLLTAILTDHVPDAVSLDQLQSVAHLRTSGPALQCFFVRQCLYDQATLRLEYLGKLEEWAKKGRKGDPPRDLKTLPPFSPAPMGLYGDLEDEGRVLIERVIVNMIPLEDIHRLLVALQREYTFDEQWLLRNILVPEVVLRLTLEDNPQMRKDLYVAWRYVRRTSQYGQGRELNGKQRDIVEDLVMHENMLNSRMAQKRWSFGEQVKYYAPLVI